MIAKRITVEAKFRRMGARWKWLRLVELLAIQGSVICLLLGVIGVLMVRGWLDRSNLATGLLVLLSVGACVSCFVTFVAVMAKHLDRKWLAGSLESADARFQDRVNTVVHLEKHRGSDAARWFLPRIARQAHTLLAEKPTRAPFSRAPQLTQLAIFAALLTATIYLNQKYSPWQHMLDAQADRLSKIAAAKIPAELALPTNNVAEETKVWGEVRITDPARDMKVTKVDVVPLQIEAAANQALKNVAWFSTVNGNDEKPHELPPPAEPRYAVYQPTLYLDELRLADWDVLTYYAGAHTQHGEGYASDVYFLEVRPFREDILKIPGGEGGQAYQALSEMTSLIERQQHIIRETHQYEQAPAELPKLRAQDRKKLSEAEDDENDSVRHLYAKMSTEMENKPIGEALDNLAKAQRSLGDATDSLDADKIKEAQNNERAALLDLIAARKMFQKALSEHPKDFDNQPKDEQPDPIAESAKKLGDIAEFRNEAKAAQDFIQKAVEQQKKLADKTASAPRSEQPKLADEETKLEKSLADFEQQHPQVFKGATNESAKADQSLKNAAQQLQKKATDSKMAADTATHDLETLQGAMQSQSAGRQLADTYKLKEMLDQQIKSMDAIKNATNELSSTNLNAAANDSRETLNQLRQATENKPTSGAFGPGLHDSLSGTNRFDLESKLNQLAQAQGKTNQQQAANDAGQALQRVSDAFNASEPSALRAAQKQDSLKSGQQESFERGMDQLESLKQQLQNGRPMSAQQESKQRQEALYNLTQGLTDMDGNNESAKQILALLDQDLKEPSKPLDLVEIKKLLDQLRNFSVEVADKRQKSENPEMTNVDPSRLPPAYRGRIEKYYQKLSDQKQ